MASSAARTVSGSSTVPVGLFGEHRNSTSGRSAATNRATAVAVTRKSSSRGAVTASAPTTLAMWECRA